MATTGQLTLGRLKEVVEGKPGCILRLSDLEWAVDVLEEYFKLCRCGHDLGDHLTDARCFHEDCPCNLFKKEQPEDVSTQDQQRIPGRG